jgi:LDH2 family malate/lactate/ureidoglycolate dehydrogenase
MFGGGTIHIEIFPLVQSEVEETMTQPSATPVASGATIRVSPQGLRAFAGACLERVGVPPGSAAIVADNLVEADLRGVESHGVARLAVYLERVAAGLVAGEAQGRVVRERAAVAVMDGENGLGAVIGSAAMDVAVRKAGQAGTAFVAVRNSNHFGTAAYYLIPAIRKHMIGFVVTNGPGMMTVWGGRARAVGTNPIAFGVPARAERPIVLDMATSVVARGKLIFANLKGEAIPEGWAVGPDGNPTCDPAVALKGALLPVGGPKGSGLALVIEMLCGLLSGGAVLDEIGELYNNPHKPQGACHLFGALDIAAFEDVGRFLDRMDKLIRDVRALPRMPNVDRIYLPGEPEWLNKEQRTRTGIPLPPALFDELMGLAKQYQVDQVLTPLTTPHVP